MNEDFADKLHQFAIRVHKLVQNQATLERFRKLIAEFKKNNRKRRDWLREMEAKGLEHAEVIFAEKERIENSGELPRLTGEHPPDGGWEYRREPFSRENGLKVA